jgi:hypothetical protein
VAGNAETVIDQPRAQQSVATVAFLGIAFNAWQVVRRTKESQWLNALTGETSIPLPAALDCYELRREM